MEKFKQLNRSMIEKMHVLENKTAVAWTILLGICIFAYTNFFDNDGYFLIATGKEIVENGIPKFNPFFLEKGYQIVVQQWLWDVCLYQIQQWFGNYGLYIWSITFFLAAMIVLYRIAKNRGSEEPWIPVIFSAFICFGFINIRPTMITVFLLSLQILVVERFQREGKGLFWLPILSLLEINIHCALWLMHFIFLLPYVVPPVKNPWIPFRAWKFQPKLLLTMIPMFLVGFINPYGMEGMLYLFHSNNSMMKEANILELQHPEVIEYAGICILMGIGIMCWQLSKKKWISSTAFYFFCGTLLMALVSRRNLVYFLFGIFMMGTEVIGRIKQYIPAGIMAILITLILSFGFLSLQDPFITEDSSRTPVKAVEYLKDKKDARIYTGFNEGGYFEYMGFQSFMDPRPEIFFKSINKKEDVFRDYLNLRTAKTDALVEKVIQKYDFEYLCASKGSRLDSYLLRKCDMVVNGNGYRLYQTN